MQAKASKLAHTVCGALAAPNITHAAQLRVLVCV